MIPAEDYNSNPLDKSLLVTERPSAVAVNQGRLLNYSFPVYSRRQVHDLCDECPGCLREGVTRDWEEGGEKPQRDSAADEKEEEIQGKLPINQTQVYGEEWSWFCFSCI